MPTLREKSWQGSHGPRKGKPTGGKGANPCSPAACSFRIPAPLLKATGVFGSCFENNATVPRGTAWGWLGYNSHCETCGWASLVFCKRRIREPVMPNRLLGSVALGVLLVIAARASAADKLSPAEAAKRLDQTLA